jgi:hypothetical protein
MYEEYANRRIRERNQVHSVVDLWGRTNSRIAYPSLVQTDNTCVFLSIAGAIDYLAGTTISEAPLLNRWNSESRPQPTFDLAIKYTKDELEANRIQTVRYHDTENPLPDIALVRDKLARGGVLIVSVELANADPSGEFTRLNPASYHMLSVFNLYEGSAQVWDPNDKAGFITMDELSSLVCGSGIAITYEAQRYLIHHDKHEMLIVTRD